MLPKAQQVGEAGSVSARPWLPLLRGSGAREGALDRAFLGTIELIEAEG
jgi:hypothetical protein